MFGLNVSDVVKLLLLDFFKLAEVELIMFLRRVRLL